MSVYSVLEALDVTPLIRLRPGPVPDARFVLDVYLGKLARRLRLLGFDPLWDRDADDEQDPDTSLLYDRASSTNVIKPDFGSPDGSIA